METILKKITESIEVELSKEEIIGMKDLPEVFGSSNINNFKQTTTTHALLGGAKCPVNCKS